MTITFFRGVNTYDELKARYKSLAKMYHPDRGGDVETMQEINNEYEFLRDRMEDYSAVNNKSDEKFREIIDKIINFNCRIEVIGSWIWCFDAYSVKDELQKLGFHWARKRKAWIWHESTVTLKRGTNLSMDRIRAIHGNEVIKEYVPMYIAS